MKTRQRVIFLGLLFGSLTLLDAENSTPAKPGDLRNAGTVDFTVTCSASVQPDFNRAVALLHSFFYEEARRIFTAHRREGSQLRDGTMGNRHDVVAPDLDPAQA